MAVTLENFLARVRGGGIPEEDRGDKSDKKRDNSVADEAT